MEVGGTTDRRKPDVNGGEIIKRTLKRPLFFNSDAVLHINCD